MKRETHLSKMADQLLSEDDYINLLELRFNNPAIKFEKAEYQSLTENLDGFTGEHNVLKISYSLNGETDTTNFFVKSRPGLQKTADMADKLLVFEKETFFYDKFIREFENRGYNTSFAPKPYLCKNNAIVMNDLKSEGYNLPGRTNLYDLEKIKSSLKALAYFHGASLIYEEEKSKELNKSFRLDLEYPNELEEKFLVFDDKQNVGYSYFYNSLDCFLKLIDGFDESEDWKNQFKQLLSNINFLEIFTKDLKARKAIGHGDLWSNNMFFKQQNGELQCCLLDYQILRYFNPAFDVLYLIYTNTRKALRNDNIDMLLSYYYDTLKEIFNQRNLSLENVYSIQDFNKSAKYYKFITRYQAACAHTFTFFDINKLRVVLEDKSFEEILNDDRPSLILELYKQDNFFAELMKEHLYEIKEILLSIQGDAE